MRAGIIDSRDMIGYWEDSIGETFECYVASEINELDDCDIIMVSAEYCGGSIDKVIEDIRSSEKLAEVPAAVVVNGSCCEEQEIFLSIGFDDVICQPLCAKLMLQRAKTLSMIQHGSEKVITLDSIMSIKDGDEGAYCVRSVDFTNIFRFVLRVLERSGKDAQILVLTLNNDGRKSQTAQKSVMGILSEAVRLCLRRGDISSVCGDDKLMVLLIGADDEGGHLVASRIVSSFYSECTDDSYELLYDIREIKAAE